MSKKQWYFFRQKLMGLVITIGFLLLSILTGEGTILLVTGPIGLYLMFTKQMVIQDEYFFEIEEKKLERLQKGS